MRNLIDRLVATEQERALAQRWADYAFRRFGADAVVRLTAGLDEPGRVKSKRALRMAIHRAKGQMKHLIAVTVRKDNSTAQTSGDR